MVRCSSSLSSSFAVLPAANTSGTRRMPIEFLLAFVMLAALIAYALLAGADFGGGIWDLMSHGSRAAEQRRHIATAIGPVWEANHVWLIFLIVLLFTCFPRAFAAASVALFWPLHLILAGIVLRG